MDEVQIKAAFVWKAPYVLIFIKKNNWKDSKPILLELVILSLVKFNFLRTQMGFQTSWNVEKLQHCNMIICKFVDFATLITYIEINTETLS